MRWPTFRRVCLLGRRACLLGVLLPALAAPMAGHAQVDSREGIALQNQLAQLRQEIQGLRADIAREGGGGGGGGPTGEIAGQLMSRVQAMEEALRQLRGRIDEVQNFSTRQNADLGKRIDDLTFQLNLQGKSGAAQPAPPPVREVAPRPAAVEPSPGAPPRIVMPATPAMIAPPPQPPQSFTFNQTPDPMREVPQPPTPPTARVDPVRPVPVPKPPAPPTPPVLASVAKPAPPPPTPPPPAAEAQNPPPDADPVIPPGGKRTPELALQEGHAALARRDYAAAERSAREVMSNRTSPRVYDGQFLLAQSLAAEKQYAQAAIAFDDTYNRSHKGRHAQDALLGLAGALTAINEKRAACDTLGRMRTEFPQVRADLQDTITKTNQVAGCAK
jgi:TolA-binding protein